jgi:hypothetical protein
MLNVNQKHKLLQQKVWLHSQQRPIYVMNTHLHFLFVLAASHLLAESPQSDWLEQVQPQ